MQEQVTHQGRISKEEIEHYRAGWQSVAKIDRQELLQMTIAQRLSQLDFLVRSAQALGIYTKAVARNGKEAQIVRQRWRQLKANVA